MNSLGQEQKTEGKSNLRPEKIGGCHKSLEILRLEEEQKEKSSWELGQTLERSN